MLRRFRRILTLLFVLRLTSTALAQERIVFVHEQEHSAFPINLIDSITIPESCYFHIYPTGQNTPLAVPADSALFQIHLPDTLLLTYHDNRVDVSNPHLESIDVQRQGTNVTVRSHGAEPLVCMVTGTCQDGRLIIDADTTCTLLLSGLQLTSNVGSAIYLKQKQKAEIVLVDGTVNTLSDAHKYTPSDTTDTSNACLYAKTSLTLAGAGTINIYGNYRHAIASGKNITVEDGHINILATQKDGIHCDKYKQKSGTVNLHLTQTATKGIKTKEEFELKGGCIEGEATAELKIADGKTSYCTFIKSDSLFTMSGGDIQLTHSGNGGRCISVDHNFLMTAGSMSLECHGDGGSYLTAANDSDYYTPKCITADDSVFIQGGHLTCLSTGLGGKGIVAGKHLSMGNEEEVNIFSKADVDEDQRFGCPKGIKADSIIIIHGGDIAVTTAGMGGEGMECNGDMLIQGGTLECNTFDDGINVARSIEISGGHVYCNSVDNDGIDSNGSITVSGGIVASVNQKRPNESFDAEDGQIFFKGGIVFGIGSAPVYVQKADIPYYSTPYNASDDGARSIGLILTEGKYICVQKGNEILMALRNDNQAFRSFLTIMSPSLTVQDSLFIVESDKPLSPQQTFFDGKLTMGGDMVNPYQITNIQVQIIH